jgi:hypothetical protein
MNERKSTMNASRLLKGAFRLSLFIIAATLLTVVAASAQDTGGRNNWTWSRSDDGYKIEVKVEGKVEFNDDYSDVASIPSDGALRVHDSRGSDTIRLAVTRGANGELLRDYTVNGARRDYDARAQTWLRDVLLLAARQGGLDARERVRRILARHGTRGVVEEIAHIEGDYARRIYFDEFLKVNSLGDQDLGDAMHNAGRTITSDYERAQLLLHVGTVFLAKRELLPAYFDTLNMIGSDYEHRRVLSGALKLTILSRDALAAMADSAARIHSDYEKATFLLEGMSRYQSDAKLLDSFRAALRTIGSDYERGRVQAKLEKVSY